MSNIWTIRSIFKACLLRLSVCGVTHETLNIRRFRNAISLFLLIAPSLLRADVTVRYKTEMNSSAAVPALPAASSIYMKGNKGVTMSGGMTTIADFAKQEITLVDTGRKKYATIPASEYGDKLAQGVARVAGASQVAAAADTMKSMKVICESKKSGSSEVIQGVQAEEREQNCSLAMQLPEGHASNPMTGMGMKFVTHIWFASPVERLRVPALWQLSGFELWYKYFANPLEALGKFMPGGMAGMLADTWKDQSVMLRLSMEAYLDMPPIPSAAAPSGFPMPAPGSPLMKMTQEIVELSTSPLDDSLFRVPDNCSPEPFEDVVNGMLQPRIGQNGLDDSALRGRLQRGIPEK
jgi:hypothetical protein